MPTPPRRRRIELYLVRSRAPGSVLWEQVGGIVAADAGGGRATAEGMARRRHAAAGGRLRVVVVELTPGTAGRVVLDLPSDGVGRAPTPHPPITGAATS